MRTVERLQKIKALDRYIDSQIEQIKRLESQALKITAGAMQTDMVQGGKRKGKDDIYVAEVGDIDARSLLQMVYIDQLDIWQICDRMGFSKATYYVKLRQAEKYLD